MKKLILLLTFIGSVTLAQAQMITEEDIEGVIRDTYNIDPKTGKDYMWLAMELKETYPLDLNNQLSFTTILEVPGKSKKELGVAIHAWFTASFADGKSAIQMFDAEQGVLLAKGYLSGVGYREGFSKSAKVNEWILIRLDIKDEKIRVITTIQAYDLELSGGVGHMLFGGVAPQGNVEIAIHKGYPFDLKKTKAYNRESAIGYVAGIVYSQVLKKKLEAAINLGITGTENQDW